METAHVDRCAQEGRREGVRVRLDESRHQRGPIQVDDVGVYARGTTNFFFASQALDPPVLAPHSLNHGGLCHRDDGPAPEQQAMRGLVGRRPIQEPGSEKPER